MVRCMWPYVTLCEMFNNAVVIYGDRRCQWWRTPEGTASNTYVEVGFTVKDLAAGLMEMGLTKGDRAAIMSTNCPQWMWADLAILNAGGCTVTIYHTASPREMSYIVNNSGSRFLFVRDSAGLKQAMENLGLMPGLEKIIVMEDIPACDDERVITMEELRLRGRRYRARNPYCYEKRWRSIQMWDWATIVYTSGTTGEPKGVVHTHQSIMAAVKRDDCNLAYSGYELTEDDVCLSFLPLAHTYEREMGQFIALHNGSTIAYCQKPSTIMEDIQVFKPTYFMSVPRIFERIYMTLRDFASRTPEGKEMFERAMDIGRRVIDARSDEYGRVNLGFDVDFVSQLPPDLQKEYEWADQAVFSKIRMLLGGRLRVAYSASASLSADLCKALLAMGIRINEGYGLTETVNSVIFNTLCDIVPGSVGKVAYGVEARIAEDGELEVRGDNIFLEYYNNPEATAEAFTEDGFFRTGDIVEVNEIGYYRIVDRKKALIVLDTGKKVPRAKVEQSFSTSRYIEQICTVGDERKYVAALVVPKFTYFIQLFKEKGIPFDESRLVFQGEGADRACVEVGEDFIGQPLLKELITSEIEEKNQLLEEHEKIKKFTILPRAFLLERDEITPTLKNKVKVITAHWADVIEDMYR